MAKPHVATIESPCPGVATYRTAAGAWVMHEHWSADPFKDDSWADVMSSAYTGGRESVEWLQEMEGDDDARSGERTFWAFDRSRNVISKRPIPPDWPIYLGADFGQRNPTAIVFLAQDPDTKRIYVFDSLYVPKGIDVGVKEALYLKLSIHLGISIEQLSLEGAYRHIERAVADPTAKAYTDFYAMEPYPVNFLHKVAGQRLPNRHLPTESRVNAALWPSMVHCGNLQYVEASDDDPEDYKVCSTCNEKIDVFPILYILEGAAPELCDQLEQTMKKSAAHEGLETPEKNVATPDHAIDALRYIVADMTWEPDGSITTEEQARRRLEKLREKPAYDRTFGDQIELVMARVQEEQKKSFSKFGRGKMTIAAFGNARGIKYSTPQKIMSTPPRVT